MCPPPKSNLLTPLLPPPSKMFYMISKTAELPNSGAGIGL